MNTDFILLLIIIIISLSIIFPIINVNYIIPRRRRKKLLKSFRESLNVNDIVNFNAYNDYGTQIIKVGFIESIENTYCIIISRNSDCSVSRYVALKKFIYPNNWFNKEID